MMMKLKLQHIAAAIMALALLPMQAGAATATGQINVTATTILPVASVQVNGALAFGAVRDTATATAQSTFNVTVTNTIPYSIAMDGGGNYNAGTNKSTLKDAGGLNAREFIMYQDVALTTIWSPAGSSMTGLTGNGVAQNYTVFGKLLAAAGTSGAVSDTVTITVTY